MAKRPRISTPLLLFALLTLVACHEGTEGYSVYNPEVEMAQMRELVSRYRPDILEEEDTYQRIVMFRDHIHWVTPITSDPIPWPFQAERYQETVEGTKGNFCQEMSIHLAAFLQAYGYQFRHVELWMDKHTPEGTPITHSVLEVWVNGRWDVHDTTYNCVWELDDGIPLSVAEMDASIAVGKTPISDTQGFKRREELLLDLDYYHDYFSTIKYTFTEVFSDDGRRRQGRCF